MNTQEHRQCAAQSDLPFAWFVVKVKANGWPCDKLQCITGLPMLAALQEMHGRGLIHRDVKPANFGVSPPGYTMSTGENFEGQHQLAYTHCDMPITH